MRVAAMLTVVRCAVSSLGIVLVRAVKASRIPRMARAVAVRALVLVVVGAAVTAVLFNHGSPLLFGSGTPRESLNDGTHAAAELVDAPAIALDSDLTSGFSMPPGQVSLTFDDGPHPKWTPLVADELDRLGVKGTFFMVGVQVRKHPGVVRDLVDRGHEVANHTHLHPQMGQLDQRAISTQLDLARLALIDATGVDSRLYRPPYSGAIRDLDQAEVVAARHAIDAGYALVATDRAPRDFDPDVPLEELVAAAMPEVGQGAVITLHDGGGGDRSRTVQMLEPLVGALRDSGYEIVPVGAVVGEVTGEPAIRPATEGTRFQAQTLGVALTVAAVIERAAIIAAIAFAVLFVGRYLMLFVLWAGTYRRHKRRRSQGPAFAGGVTVIVPAYNEAVGIEAAVRSIAASEWPDVEVLVVDDGSEDGTADIVEALRIDGVRVLRKPNGGKASALNLGIHSATHDVVVMVDGDTILEPGTIPAIVAPLSDPDVGAVAGNPKIGNADGLLPALQASEYLMSSSLERRMLAPAGMITTIPGAVGAWRRSALRDVGLVSSETLAEDTDLTVAIARGGWRIAYAPHARAWTEAPSTLNALFTQRVRWTFGTLQVLWKHRGARHDRGAGSQLGRVALPYMFLTGYLFAALAPVMDVVLLTNVLLGNWELAAASWFGIAAVGAAAGVAAARLDGDRLWPGLLVPVQQLVFRPLLHTVSWASVRRAAMGQRQRWGTQQRRGGLVMGAVTQT